MEVRVSRLRRFFSMSCYRTFSWLSDSLPRFPRIGHLAVLSMSRQAN
jgi:hypothetical protein